MRQPPVPDPSADPAMTRRRWPDVQPPAGPAFQPGEPGSSNGAGWDVHGQSVDHDLPGEPVGTPYWGPGGPGWQASGPHQAPHGPGWLAGEPHQAQPGPGRQASEPQDGSGWQASEPHQAPHGSGWQASGQGWGPDGPERAATGPYRGPDGSGWPGGPRSEPADHRWAGTRPLAEPGGSGWAEGRPPAETDGHDRTAGGHDPEPGRDPGSRRPAGDQNPARSAADADSTDPSGGGPVAGRHEDEAWAILACMSAAIFGFGPPLVIYLLKMRVSPFVRAHAAQAVNTAATLFLYLLCVVIVGGMLALDSLTVALLTGGIAAALLWTTALIFLVRATIAASGGTFYRIPGWLCATFLRR